MSDENRPTDNQFGPSNIPQLISAHQSSLIDTAIPAPLSPEIADRVFPIRSAVSRDPNPTPGSKFQKEGTGYFDSSSFRRFSGSVNNTPVRNGRPGSADGTSTSTGLSELITSRKTSASLTEEDNHNMIKPRQSSISLTDSTTPEQRSVRSDDGNDDSRPRPMRSQSMTSNTNGEEGIYTARFKHVVSEGGHMIITGRDGDTLQRCEDEPIHIPGAVQGFGLLIALEEESEGKLSVRIVSENTHRIIGYTPKQLFGLESFTDILTEDQADNLLDHIDFIRDEDANVVINGPEVFTILIRSPSKKATKLWCAIHINDKNPNLIICEFELEDDPDYPQVPVNDGTPEPPEDTLNSAPTPLEYAESTQNISRPLRVLRSARKRKGEAAAMEVFNIMSQVQEQLAAAPNLDKFLKVLVGVVKELTGFHRVMVYQFDGSWNGRVVTELVDPRATKDLYKGLNFPASDIPSQARDLYKINKVRMLYDRDQETARLVCRTAKDLEQPLDMTYSYLRAMSPIHVKYLANMAVRSSMSISINAFDELWGLIACHSYGGKGMRVSFPIRKMCRLVGDSAGRNIERLSYASRLQARKLINTAPSQNNPSGYIIASSEDLIRLFDADCGLLSIKGETKVLGHLEQSQEALALLEYLRMRKITNVMTSQDLKEDFPDLRYAPGIKHIAGLLLVPLSVGGHDFIVFFRKGQLKEIKWAGNPYEKFIKQGTEGYLEPRKSFKTWSETVVGKCKEWTEEEIETAAVLCLVYGKFIEVWRQKEAALQNSQLTKLLLANSAHEVRTPLNAIINYLEIALEGSLDQETRENLSKSHSASKSLIYVINDLLDLTKTEQGIELIKDEIFDLHATLIEATKNFEGDAKRKQISYKVVQHPCVPKEVIGDERKVRQAISNITANAIQNTSSGGITIDLYVTTTEDNHADIECSVTDTGTGMSSKRLDALFRELEQVHGEGDLIFDTAEQKLDDGKRVLGLGLAVVARIIRNMNGQMRLKSDEGKGTRFVLSFPFQLPEKETKSSVLSTKVDDHNVPMDDGEITVIERDNSRRNSTDLTIPRPVVNRNPSNESLASRKSFGSINSGKSQASQRSEADRLIDAIQEPHLIGRDTKFTNNKFSKDDKVISPPTTREIQVGPPGQAHVPDQRTPIRSIRMLEEFEQTFADTSPLTNQPIKSISAGDHSRINPKKMRVLVAEDDPVNSRIIKKRLEKLGHLVYLTVNGEECSSTFGDNSKNYDVVLMDMQVSITFLRSKVPDTNLVPIDANCRWDNFNKADTVL